MSSEIQLTDKNTTGKALDHLGLVMSTIDRLGIIEKIDHRLPLAQDKNPKTSMGQRVAAMILNGLGFMDNRLYMFPDFLENKPVARLLGDSVTAENFNDDALGRCLDKIYEYGVTPLFSELAFSIGAEQQLLGDSAHFDTTTLSVYGDYDNEEELLQQKNISDISSSAIENKTKKSEAPIVTYGYSKDHRPDLKQVVLNLATTGASGFPIWMESHSGNAADQKELRAAAERMQDFCKELEKSPSFMYVADSAMYDSCIKEGGYLKWLSRVPERNKWAKELLQYEDAAYTWTTLSNGYRICIIEREDQGIYQRLCIVSSEQAYHREIKTFEKNLEKQLKQHMQQLWHLSNKIFGCEKDAEKAIREFNKKMKYHLTDVCIEAIYKHSGQGRPKKDAIAEVVGYKVAGSIIEKATLIEKTRRQKGRFLLSTNELDRQKLPDNLILKEYKEQSKTESGFRFIKDDIFEVSSIFLKKPSRISALMMIMTLCLMVYSVAQYQMRQALEKVDREVFDPEKKLPKKITLKRVFKLFYSVHELTVQFGNHVQCLIINVSDLGKRIIRCFGSKAMAIYDLSG